MKIQRTTLFVAALFVVFAASLNTAAAQSGKVKWAVSLNETRGPIRAPDLSKLLAKEATSEILGGPTNGSDAAYLIYTRMPPGAHGPALFTVSVEHYYVVTAGQLTVQIGTDTFVAGPLVGVVIPPNTPHEAWNAGTEAEAHLEVIAPATSRDLMSMLTPARPRKVENAAQCIRKIQVPAPATLKPGLNRQAFTNREMGSPITVALDSSPTGAGGPRSHVHRFEQVYFMVEGTTTVMYGLDNPQASKNSIVIIPPGVVHTNSNSSGTFERHITLLLPEPEQQPFDIEFEMKGPVGGSSGAAPAPR